MATGLSDLEKHRYNWKNIQHSLSTKECASGTCKIFSGRKNEVKTIKYSIGSSDEALHVLSRYGSLLQ